MPPSSDNAALFKPSTRFLCDVMLARFARYLRAAGYDAAVADNSAADRDIIRRAVAEGRWLLTVDRKIREHKAAWGLLVTLPHASLNEQARTLQAHFAMDWTARAFSRCILDNALLVAPQARELEQVPEDVLRSGEPLMRCPCCGRVYWRGSHYRRMMGRLQRWQERDFA